MDKKSCSICKRELPLTKEYFFVCKGLKSGFKSACKDCMGFKAILDGTKICSQCDKTLPATKEHFKKSITGKYGLNSLCKRCSSENDKLYRQENKESVRLQKKKYQQENKEQLKVKKAQYYKKNKSEIQTKSKIWYSSNKEAIIERTKKYYLNNTDEIKKRVKLYNALNPHIEQISTQKRKALKLDLPNDFNKHQWAECKKTFDDSCAYCGEEKPLAQEHFIPLSKGGEFTKNNIIPSCKSCNSKKHVNNFFEWYPKQSFYSKKRERAILKYLNVKENTQQIAFL